MAQHFSENTSYLKLLILVGTGAVPLVERLAEVKNEDIIGL